MPEKNFSHSPSPSPPVPLSKFLSSAGVASRRKAARLVQCGKVSVNGKVELRPAAHVSAADSVVCEGKPVVPRTLPRHYIMLHKPRGFVCTAGDIHAKKKALDLIRLDDGARLFSAGRLDKDSEGLILFSDDGDFVQRLTHPRHKVKKTYEVSLSGALAPDDFHAILSGVSENGEILKALCAEEISANKYRLVLGEGKNREIRRMMSALGKNVRRLKRTGVGALTLGALKPGRWRELSGDEIALALADPGFAPEKSPH